MVIVSKLQYYLTRIEILTTNYFYKEHRHTWKDGLYIEPGSSFLPFGEFDDFTYLYSVVPHFCIMLWHQDGISMEILVSPDGH